MLPTEKLRELQTEFDSARVDRRSHYKELEKLRKKFVNRFPPSKISKLTLEEYVQGKRSKESFCYWVERETSVLGHIQGAPSPKFGIYFSKETNAFKFTSKFKSPEDARMRILSEIGKLLDAADVDDINSVRSAEISPMFKGKILSLYFPQRFINIFSERHVDYFLSHLRLNNPTSPLDLIDKKEVLMNFKNADELMATWSMFEFSDFLYWAWPPPSRDGKVPTILKDFSFTFLPPEKTTPEFISLELGETNDSSGHQYGNKKGTINFEEKNRRNKLTGNQGEDIVFVAEARWLLKNGKPDLSHKVEAVCKTDDSAGYDILSFDLDGTPKQIEVKATAAKPPEPNKNFVFYLSATEYEMAQKLSNYYLYIVFEVKSQIPKILPIKNPASLEPKRLVLKPSAYRATLTAAS